MPYVKDCKHPYDGSIYDVQILQTDWLGKIATFRVRDEIEGVLVVPDSAPIFMLMLRDLLGSTYYAEHFHKGLEELQAVIDYNDEYYCFPALLKDRPFEREDPVGFFYVKRRDFEELLRELGAV